MILQMIHLPSLKTHTTLEKHEVDNRHSDVILIKESLGFAAFRHYAVQTG